MSKVVAIDNRPDSAIAALVESEELQPTREDVAIRDLRNDPLLQLVADHPEERNVEVLCGALQTSASPAAVLGCSLGMLLWSWLITPPCAETKHSRGFGQARASVKQWMAQRVAANAAAASRGGGPHASRCGLSFTSAAMSGLLFDVVGLLSPLHPFTPSTRASLLSPRFQSILAGQDSI